jgi:uncharacterized RDD family membrane protein YckC
MKNRLATILSCAVLFLGGPAPLLTPHLAAQTDDTTGTNETTTVKIGPVEVSTRHRSSRDKVAVGSDVVLKAGEAKRDVVVVFGDATIDGTVNNDLVVVFGTARLGPTAEVKHDVVVVGGKLEAHPDAKIGHDRVEVGLHANWGWLRWLKQWSASALLLGRPLAPQYGWTWIVAGAFLALYILAAILLPKPVQACVTALEAKPVSSFFTGVLSLVLFGPLTVLLTATGVGVLVLPFLFCAMIVAFLLGRVAVYRYAGQQIGGQIGLTALQRPVLALVVGAVIFHLLYIVPFLGFIVWGAIVPLGVGATVLAFFRSFRSETMKPNAVGLPIAPVTAGGDATPASVIANPPVVLSRVGFWRRTLATLLDLLLIAILIRVLSDRHGPIPQLVIVLWLAYHVVLWSWKGATIGGMALGIRIVRRDGAPLGFGVAMVRALAGFFSAIALGLGFFWAGWDREKQSWHDKIAGTIVVKAPPGTPLV